MKYKLTPWFFAFSKRLLQKRIFVLLLCLFPLFSFAIRMYSSSDKPLIQVALYNEGHTALAEETIASLEELDSTIAFYEVQSSGQLYKDVKTTKAECGYIFTKEYKTDHVLERKNRKKVIKVVESPASILSGSINELVFASYFKVHNEQLLVDYLKQPGVVKKGQDTDEIVSKAAMYFETYASNENILQPEKSSGNNQKASKEQLIAKANEVTERFLSDVGRGVFSVLILLTALCGGVGLRKDRKNGLFGAVSPEVGWKLGLLDIMTPVIFIAVTGYAGLLILPAGQFFIKELGALVFYVIAVVLVTAIVERLSGGFYSTIIPLLILGALIFAPVFMDFSVYAKILVIPKYLFINTYYLEMVHGGIRELLIASGVLVVLGIFHYALRYLKEHHNI